MPQAAAGIPINTANLNQMIWNYDLEGIHPDAPLPPVPKSAPPLACLCAMEIIHKKLDIGNLRQDAREMMESLMTSEPTKLASATILSPGSTFGKDGISYSDPRGIYVGTFNRAGQRYGYGKRVKTFEGHPNGRVSETETGNWVNGVFEGEGTVVNIYEVREDRLISESITGTFVDGKLNGEGERGRTYEGRADGLVSHTLTGNFVDGVFQGQGTDVQRFEGRADGLVSETNTGKRCSKRTFLNLSLF